MIQPITLRLLAAALALSAFMPVEAESSPITFDLQVTLDYPGAIYTYAYGLNDRGVVAGSYSDANGMQGFTYGGNRYSRPIGDPNERQNSTAATGINNQSTVCGYYFGNDAKYHDFLLTGTTFTELNFGVVNGEVLAVNDAGNLCGTANALSVGFVVIDGTTTTFTIPGAEQTIARGLNNLNQVVGSYTISGVTAGFLREPDGTLVYPIAAAGKIETSLSAIDDRGEMVGSVGDLTGIYGALFSSPTRYTAWAYPGGGDPPTTVFTGINRRGQITGFTVTATGGHGFVVLKSGH